MADERVERKDLWKVEQKVVLRVAKTAVETAELKAATWVEKWDVK